MIKVPPRRGNVIFLCRGIARRTGEQVYGGIVYDPWGDPYIFKWHENGQKVFTRIDPDSISYFTGMCDKSGQPIFSTDIIQVKDFLSRVYEVNACWLVKDPTGAGVPLCYVERKDIEVVEITREPITL